MARRRLIITVTGKVQGVGFRYGCKSYSENLHLSGMARNEGDGSVYIEAEGQGAQLKKLIDWCRTGPEGAEVKGVEYKEEDPAGYDGFDVC